MVGYVMFIWSHLSYETIYGSLLLLHALITCVTIGKGNFGIVFHGIYFAEDDEMEGDKVAIKTMSRIEDIHSIELFLREGNIDLFIRYA